MIKLFRKIRQNLLTENKFSKYLLYAIGEIVLVVIGILIALNLNNRNQEKQEQLALNGYLNSIAKNIDSDIEKAQFINRKREKFIDRYSIQLDYYDKSDIKLISQNFIDVTQLDYFNPNLSGFESLKNSGYLSKLQGSDIEELLNVYYNLVNEITLTENNYNRNIENARNQFASIQESRIWLFFAPENIGPLSTPLEEMQPIIKSILEQSWTFWAFTKPENLIILYDNLCIYGEVITRMIKEDKRYLDMISKKKLSLVFNSNDENGYHFIIQNGTLSSFYNQGTADIINNITWYNNKPGRVEADFPQAAWAYIYFHNGYDALQKPLAKDYSSYKSIRLELKGAKGGEKVFINLKDKNDPNDGNESRVPLILTDDWKTYEIPLSEFKTANLEEIAVAAGILSLEESKTISIRNIEYLR
jgi:hypothetical protein